MSTKSSSAKKVREQNLLNKIRKAEYISSNESKSNQKPNFEGAAGQSNDGQNITNIELQEKVWFEYVCKTKNL